MSLLRVVVIALATLFLFAGPVISGKDGHGHDGYDDYDYDDDDYCRIWGPRCCDDKWKWSYNSLGHHPCKIAAYLLSTCHNGGYYIPPLGSDGYEVPCKDGLCECNTVIYSLLSACEACQGGKWPYYNEYVKKCSKVLNPGHFPYPVPYGTKIPKWAFLDVTYNNTWDPVKAQATGCQPEADSGTNLA